MALRRGDLVVRFEQLVRKGRRLTGGDELAPASAILAEAPGLWRGKPLAGPPEPSVLVSVGSAK